MSKKLSWALVLVVVLLGLLGLWRCVPNGETPASLDAPAVDAPDLDTNEQQVETVATPTAVEESGGQADPMPATEAVAVAVVPEVQSEPQAPDEASVPETPEVQTSEAPAEPAAVLEEAMGAKVAPEPTPEVTQETALETTPEPMLEVAEEPGPAIDAPEVAPAPEATPEGELEEPTTSEPATQPAPMFELVYHAPEGQITALEQLEDGRMVISGQVKYSRAARLTLNKQPLSELEWDQQGQWHYETEAPLKPGRNLIELLWVGEDGGTRFLDGRNMLTMDLTPPPEPETSEPAPEAQSEPATQPAPMFELVYHPPEGQITALEQLDDGRMTISGQVKYSRAARLTLNKQPLSELEWDQQGQWRYETEAPLEPGRNLIELLWVGQDGGTRFLDGRTVLTMDFTPPPEPQAETQPTSEPTTQPAPMFELVYHPPEGQITALEQLEDGRMAISGQVKYSRAARLTLNKQLLTDLEWDQQGQWRYETEAPLKPGRNLIELLWVGKDGGTLFLDGRNIITMDFTPPPAPAAEVEPEAPAEPAPEPETVEPAPQPDAAPDESLSQQDEPLSFDQSLEALETALAVMQIDDTPLEPLGLLAAPEQKSQAEPAPEPEKAVVVGAFDVVRLNDAGYVVLAGSVTGSPAARLKLNGAPLADLAVSMDGSWSFITPEPMPEGSSTFILEAAQTEDDATVSDTPPQEPLAIATIYVLPKQQKVTAIAAPVPTVPVSDDVSLDDTPLAAPVAISTVEIPVEPATAIGETDTNTSGDAQLVAAVPTEEGNAETGNAEPQAAFPVQVASTQQDQETQQTQPTQPVFISVTQSSANRAFTITSVLDAPREDNALYIERVDYDSFGNISLSGDAENAQKVMVYLDNDLLGQAKVDRLGRWRYAPPGQSCPPGTHELRVDLIDWSNRVISRVAVPFERQASSWDTEGKVDVTIKRYDNLWTIASRAFGEGAMYSVIYDKNRGQIRNPDLIYPGQIFSVEKKKL